MVMNTMKDVPSSARGPTWLSCLPLLLLRDDELSNSAIASTSDSPGKDLTLQLRRRKY